MIYSMPVQNIQMCRTSDRLYSMPFKKNSSHSKYIFGILQQKNMDVIYRSHNTERGIHREIFSESY